MARHTKAQAARALGVSRTTLYRLIEHGALSPAPDGLIDDTELVRAAPGSTPSRNVSLRPMTLCRNVTRQHTPLSIMTYCHKVMDSQ